MDQALARDVKIADEAEHWFVRNPDLTLSVRECNSVDRPVDQAAHQRRVTLEFALALLLIRDLDDEALAIGMPSISDRCRGIPHPDRRVIRANEPVLAFERITGRHRSRVLRKDAITVVRVQRIPPEAGIGEPCGRRKPDYRCDLGANVRQTAGILRVHRERQALDEPPTPPFAVA